MLGNRKMAAVKYRRGEGEQGMNLGHKQTVLPTFETLRTVENLTVVSNVLALLSPLTNRGAASPQGFSTNNMEALSLIFSKPACSLEKRTLLRCTVLFYNKVETASSVQYCSQCCSSSESIKNSFYNLFMYFYAPSTPGSLETSAGLSMSVTVRLNMWFCN